MRSKEDAIQFGVKYTVIQEAAGADVGDIVLLLEDDGSDAKHYINLTKAGSRSLSCISSYKLEAEVMGADTVPEIQVEFGVLYRSVDSGEEGVYHNAGDLLVLQEDDGSSCPWFYNLSRPEPNCKIAVAKHNIEVYTGAVTG